MLYKFQDFSCIDSITFMAWLCNNNLVILLMFISNSKYIQVTNLSGNCPLIQPEQRFLLSFY